MAKIAFSCRSGSAWYRLATDGTQTGFRNTGAGRKPPRRRSIASSAWMCGIDVPQQPPIRFTPSSATNRSLQDARSAPFSG